MRLLLALGCAVLALAASALPTGGQPVTPETFYVSPVGYDGAAGTSPSTAWRSLARVEAVDLDPGDRVLLEGGTALAGELRLTAEDAGTTASPVAIGSYGTARATIAAGDRSGIYITDAAGIVVAGINVVGSGRTANTGDGISFANQRAGVLADYVRLRDVDVHGFGEWGVVLGGWYGASGYRDVRIERVRAYDNGVGGILTWAVTRAVHRSVTVTSSAAWANTGVPGRKVNSGNGITLGSVAGGLIERSVAHDNGGLNDGPEGGVGIWAYDSDRVRIERNESYDNRTGGPTDGDGFDLDQNTSNSVLQYNYSHGNDGAGFLLAHRPDNSTFTGNTVRYNVSQDDGRRNRYAPILLWGRVLNTQVHNNTVFARPSAIGSPRAAVAVTNASIETHDLNRVGIRNNVLMTTGGVPLLDVAATQLDGLRDLRFEGNHYFSREAPFTVRWGRTTYTGLRAWRAATGQERVGVKATGSDRDPQLVAPGAGPTFGDAARLPELRAYRLRSGSPLVDAGLDLVGLFRLSPGPRDYFGGAVPIGLAPDVGAHEQQL